MKVRRSSPDCSQEVAKQSKEIEHSFEWQDAPTADSDEHVIEAPETTKTKEDIKKIFKNPSPSDSSWNEKRYTIKDVTSALGISRSTLLWYEKIGIVSPAHDKDSGWRKYSAADIFKIMGATTLKNSGVALSDLEGEFGELAFTPEKIDEYIAYSRRQEGYFRAQAECLQSIKDVITHSGEMRVGMIDEFYFFPDSSENGYQGYEGSEQLDLLARKLPISALGAASESDWGEPVKIRWGRTVPVRYAELIDLPPSEHETFGACLCLCYFHASKNLPASPEEQQQGLRSMEDYLNAERLMPNGRLFVPRVIPFGKGACSALCLPVKQKEGMP